VSESDYEQASDGEEQGDMDMDDLDDGDLEGARDANGEGIDVGVQAACGTRHK